LSGEQHLFTGELCVVVSLASIVGVVAYSICCIVYRRPVAQVGQAVVELAPVAVKDFKPWRAGADEGFGYQDVNPHHFDNACNAKGGATVARWPRVGFCGKDFPLSLTAS
jgi:hypothetical protein